MQIFRFDTDVGRAIDRFESRKAVVSRIVHLTAEAHVNCIHVAAGGVVGYHEAVVPQLFLVVAGHGWVRGELAERVPIVAGQAAFWQQGEGHESGSETGMTAVVIESEGLNPAEVMLERSE